MLVVPVQATPSQTLTCQLSGQATQLNIYQASEHMFMDVLLAGVVVISGVICQNANRIIRDLYLGYVGDFAWFDTQAPVINGVVTPADPYYTGLGTRWILMYLAPSDIS